MVVVVGLFLPFVGRMNQSLYAWCKWCCWL